MVSDLIEKFFRKDLTEAEQEALGKELESSDESAQQFGEKADAVYDSFGLPKPRWAGPETLRPRPGPGTWGWLSLMLLLAATIGGTVWVYFHSIKKPSTMVISNNSSQQKKNPIAALNSPLTVAQTVPQNQGKAKTTQETSPLPTPQAITSKASTPATSPLIPKFTPVNVDKNPNQPFSSLAVQLHLSSPRTLTVRVLDGQGNELLPLFNGTLPAGTWAFEWNGLLKDGRLAPPGMYKIEVRAGSWAQTKDVLIQK